METMKVPLSYNTPHRAQKPGKNSLAPECSLHRKQKSDPLENPLSQTSTGPSASSPIDSTSSKAQTQKPSSTNPSHMRPTCKRRPATCREEKRQRRPPLEQMRKTQNRKSKTQMGNEKKTTTGSSSDA